MFITNLFKHWTYQVFAPGTVLKEKYEAFKSLLTHDKKAHELMAELEEIYHNQTKVDIKVIENKYNALSGCVSEMLTAFSKMCPSCHPDLKDYFKRFDSYIKYIFTPTEFSSAPPFTMQLKDIPSRGQALVGNKALNLSTIEKALNLPIPRGFVITTNAFYYFVEFNALRKSIDERLARLDINSTASLNATSHELMDNILKAQMPPDMAEDILNAFHTLKKTLSKNARLAMRSSAVGEDTKSSFAGQYRTILNVGKEDLLDAYKAVIASKYAPRALYYRINYGLSDIETPMAIIALEMIDATISGIMYTEDIEHFEPNTLTIHAIWGLGELLVGGKASPDIINLKKGEKPKVIRKQVGLKPQRMALAQYKSTEVLRVDDDKQRSLSIDDPSALVLADWGIRLEKHFKGPQDIEWCMDNDGKLFLLQSRPLQSEEIELNPPECEFNDIKNAVLISGGERACSGIGAGKVFMVDQESDLGNIPEGAVLVARNASPQYVTVMNRLSAVVTDTGSTAGHFASVTREFGVPALVNTGVATTRLHHGSEVTVYADDKEVYDGIVQAMLESPCARKNLLLDSPFARKLRYVINFISPLKLTEPQADSFVPEGSRSLHDILRFTHEKAVQEMFHMGNRRIRKVGGARKLITDIPMLFYVVDVGSGLRQGAGDKKTVRIDDILSAPMNAVFKGLSNPGILWSTFTHFDWAEYDKIVMSGGIISPEAAIFASYAVISHDYLNLNLRFGYHFVILDTICGDRAEDNYILFRFSGGGADFEKRSLRADFLSSVLQRLGFRVDKKSDLIDAQFKGEERKRVDHTLDMTGRLLGATRLMDMYLKDSAMVETYADDFMNGRYHFASVEETA